MSELKAYKGDVTIPVYGSIADAKVYLKEDADKALAEKDKEIAELKDKLQNVSELLTETKEWLIESQKMHKRCADGAIKKIRHQKYKRCLAMALLALEKRATYRAEYEEWCLKWQNRWLELAEKFKEAK